MPTQRANGIDIYYEMAGQGEPLLLLHGLGSRSDDWQLQLPAFAARYCVVAADMRGHGRTAKPPGPTSVPMMAADVLGLLDALGIDAAHVVGLSMGGMIAFQMAVNRPERVRSLVIVNSAPALVAHTWGERLRIWQRLALARLFKPARTAHFLGPRLFDRERHVARDPQADTGLRDVREEHGLLAIAGQDELREHARAATLCAAALGRRHDRRARRRVSLERGIEDT